MRRFLVALLPLTLACGGSASKDDDTGAAGAGGSSSLPVEKLAVGIGLSEISVYQAVKIPIMSGGVAVEPTNAPIVAGRAAMLRVFVHTHAEWQPREVVVRLQLSAGSEVFPPQEIRRNVIRDSVEDDLGSTFAFDVPADQMRPDVAYAVSIFEGDPAVVAPGGSGGSSWPVGGLPITVGARPVGPLQVMLAPIEYRADGSGRVPNLGEAQLAAYRDAFYGVYPVPAVEITVRSQPIPFSIPIDAFGDGWEQLLEQVLFRRDADGVADDVYYYGIFQPTDSIYQFCREGCIAGLSLQPDLGDVFARGSIGLGYSGDVGGSNSAETMIHEIGHAHGLGHAPCGLLGQRSEFFPYEEATLGSWGWDSIAAELISPASRTDMMSYCHPYWISDYNYGRLFGRSLAVNSLASIARPLGSPTEYQMLSVDARGTVRPGAPVTLGHVPLGAPRTIELVSAEGQTTSAVTGYFYPYDHLPGGLLLIPRSSQPKIRYAGRIQAL